MLTIFAEKTKLLTYSTLLLTLMMLYKSEASFSVKKEEKVYPGRYEIVVTRVHDGDTVIAEIVQLPPIIGESISIRIDGIDAPEITDKRLEIKQKAQAAKSAVVNAVRGAYKVEITNLKRDKYFRLLADVLVDDKDLGKMLLDKGLVKPYNGGAKSPW